MKVFKLRKTNMILIYFGVLLCLEMAFKILTKNPVFNISSLYIIINSLMVSIFLTGLNTLFKNEVNKVLFYVILFIICLIFAAEFCVFKIFGFYFDLSLLGAADQVVSFASDGLKLVLENILGVMLIFFPFVIALSLNRYIVIHQKKWQKSVLYLIITVVLFGIFNLSLWIKKDEENSAYKLYYETHNNELSLKKFGVLHGFFVDVRKTVFNFQEKIDIDMDMVENINEENETDIVYEYNNLDIDFDSLISSTNNNTVKQMHEYFQNEKGTRQNEYTGFFEGKNLVLFMAESFNEIAVDEERTPTLYKLIHSGFVFNDFYTPTISSTIGGEFQELTGLVAESGFISPWKKGTNSYPFGIATTFKNMNYNTFAYHDHSYTFQNRYKYLAALGFDNFKGCRNGLEKLINCNQWPESDVEMINATYQDYINSEEPFFTYYVTVSGHGNYGWANTAMGRKHKDAVIDLPYDEEVLSYLAAQIELDQALELLIEKLDEAGVLDDTVIALVGDHYPYYLSTEQVNSAARYKKDSVVEINHSNFILWNNKMETVKVDKIGSQIDVLPTLYNLFGVKYDSRLIIGKDILSTEPGLAIFGNRSWVSDYGTYFSSSGKFVLKEGKSVDENYVKNMNKIVGNKMNMSKLIMTTDYYKYFK